MPCFFLDILRRVHQHGGLAVFIHSDHVTFESRHEKSLLAFSNAQILAGKAVGGAGGRVNPVPSTPSASDGTTWSQKRRKPMASRPRQKRSTPSSIARRQVSGAGSLMGPPMTATPCAFAAAMTRLYAAS